MKDDPARLKLGTRGSPLALAQAREARSRLVAAQGWGEDQVEIVVIKTTGDAIQDRPLLEAGGKGLFTKELDTALLEGAIDVAIHSAKDLPTNLPDAIVIAGYFEREDVRDALITARGTTFEDLPRGGAVGTASLRRQAQVLRRRPDLTVKLLRGNVGSRLRKVEAGEYDATLLALAGLNRLGLAHHATAILDAEIFLPAVGQGAIAVTVRQDDAQTLQLVAAVIHAPTTEALACERAFLAVLDGSCRTPIAGYARMIGGNLIFSGLVLSPDGADALDVTISGPPGKGKPMGAEAGRALLARGSRRLHSRSV